MSAELAHVWDEAQARTNPPQADLDRRPSQRHDRRLLTCVARVERGTSQEPNGERNLIAVVYTTPSPDGKVRRHITKTVAEPASLRGPAPPLPRNGQTWVTLLQASRVLVPGGEGQHQGTGGTARQGDQAYKRRKK